MLKNGSEIREKRKSKDCLSEVPANHVTDPREINNDFFNWVIIQMCFVFDSYFNGGNRTGGGWELKVWKSNQIKLNSTFRKIGQSRLCYNDHNKKKEIESC